MIELAEKNLCTGCGACAFVCPQEAIGMRENEIGIVYPVINEEKCISCKKCQKVCPILNPISYHTPKKAYAAWSADEQERRTSASGGIAIEVYKKALEDGCYVAGAKQNEDFSVTFELTNDRTRLSGFKNSKYVFSSAYSLFPEIKKKLADNEKIVVIGLPCQIAAIRKIFKDNSNLLLMDVVCHGITPSDYLNQHICKLSTEASKVAVRMSFRDPVRYTYTYTFTLYDADGECFYAKRTKDGDTYQYGYHRSISYRENCYHCAFARTERASDVTLSDYNGLGKLAPCSFSARKVSSVLIHTEKGNRFINELIKERRIVAEERPLQEPILGDERLRHPSKKTQARKDFERLILLYNGDFEKTMNVLIPVAIRRERLWRIMSLPKRVINKIVNIIR